MIYIGKEDCLGEGGSYVLPRATVSVTAGTNLRDVDQKVSDIEGENALCSRMNS
jgi:hypothetical protein